MACSVGLFILAMTKRVLYPVLPAMDYYTLLSIKNTEESECCIQQLLDNFAIPSAVLADCLNLHAVLTVQGLHNLIGGIRFQLLEVHSFMTPSPRLSFPLGKREAGNGTRGGVRPWDETKLRQLNLQCSKQREYIHLDFRGFACSNRHRVSFEQVFSKFIFLKHRLL